LFVHPAPASRAYEDTPRPSAHGQTISQPWVVARMTEALLISGEPARVLEVGTGCGYQTAVLARLVGEVYTVERLGVLLRKARTRLRGLGIHNVHYRHGDGFAGWPEAAPFDAILVAAAPEQVPDTLLAQLAVGGALIIPVGPPGAQELLRIERTEDGYESNGLGMVSFVPMLGGRI
jgi:protein-L-isoaspartate(D-aspartate) O-methyltransferase